MKAILSIDEGKAYLQNADTNQYLETALAGKAATSHTQAASTITAGTFPETAIVAKTGTDYGSWRIRNIAAHTDTITAGSTALTNGNIYLQYE